MDEERESFNFRHFVKFLSKDPIVIFFLSIKSHNTKSSFVYKLGNLQVFVIIFFFNMTVDNPISQEKSNCL